MEHEIRFRVDDVQKVINDLVALGCNYNYQFLQTRSVFDTGTGKSSWLRLRKGEKVTFALKSASETGVQEFEVEVDSYEKMLNILISLGYQPRAQHENYRRKLIFSHRSLKAPIEIDLDTWPEIGHVLEIEGAYESDVLAAVGLLGLDGLNPENPIWEIYEKDGLTSILDRDLSFSDEELQKWNILR